jgi:hypothetical protein
MLGTVRFLKVYISRKDHKGNICKYLHYTNDWKILYGTSD